MSNEQDLLALARIDFLNHDVGYEYNICPFHEISTQIQTSESFFQDKVDWESPRAKPTIKITPCFMTRAKYNEWLSQIDTL